MDQTMAAQVLFQRLQHTDIIAEGRAGSGGAGTFLSA
jgi:hypothetical protein